MIDLLFEYFEDEKIEEVYQQHHLVNEYVLYFANEMMRLVWLKLSSIV
jgi:hypothetical protein